MSGKVPLYRMSRTDIIMHIPKANNIYSMIKKLNESPEEISPSGFVVNNNSNTSTPSPPSRVTVSNLGGGADRVIPDDDYANWDEVMCDLGPMLGKVTGFAGDVADFAGGVWDGVKSAVGKALSELGGFFSGDDDDGDDGGSCSGSGGDCGDDGIGEDGSPNNGPDASGLGSDGSGEGGASSTA